MASPTSLPVAQGRVLRRVRVGVFHPDFGLEDAGWCRLVLEQAGFEVRVVDRRHLAAEGFGADLEVLVLPAMDRKVLAEGRSGGRPLVSPPPEYLGGLATSGAAAVRRFAERGGTVIAFGGSAEWLAEACEAAVSAPTRSLGKAELLSPGALLRVQVDQGSSLGWGIGEWVNVVVDDPLGFETRPAGGTTSRQVEARFPDEPLLVAGWMRGEEKLRRRAAAVVVEQGVGPARALRLRAPLPCPDRGRLSAAVQRAAAGDGRPACVAIGDGGDGPWNLDLDLDLDVDLDLKDE